MREATLCPVFNGYTSVDPKYPILIYRSQQTSQQEPATLATHSPLNPKNYNWSGKVAATRTELIYLSYTLVFFQTLSATCFYLAGGQHQAGLNVRGLMQIT